MRAYTILLLTFCWTAVVSQTLPPGPQVVTFYSDVDDTEQPYGLYIPKNYDKSKKYPLVMMLHGAGSNHRLALRRVFGKSNAAGETDVEVSRTFPQFKDVDYIVASPYARGTMGYQGIAEKDVMDVLADVKKRFNIDEDRTYLTGLSMGGGGTLWIGLTRPDIWAALAPVCPAPPQGTNEFAANGLNLPFHFFHGDKDPAVPVTVSRDWVKNLKDLGASAEYIEYPGVLHNSWENAYADAAIFDWFAKFKRNSFPDRVTFNTKNYKYNKAYWVQFDQLTPGTLASIDAKFTGVNQLVITSSSLGGFTLGLAGHPKYKSGQSLDVTINGMKVKTTPAGSLSFKEEKGKWINARYEAAAGSKTSGAEGPIGAAFSSRHIYVYGTGGSPNEEELKNRRQTAEQAANWSQYVNAFIGRVMVFPRVVADKDVRPSDIEAANLILFGTSQTNTLIDKYKSQLPVELSPSAQGYGLLYVFPMNNRYVVVNSGLPWWTTSKASSSNFTTMVRQTIPGFKDFVLFKDGNDNRLVEGYFDQNWKLSPADKAALTGTGAVQ
jgi:pimeloyl-ACP methyl ester carboxylesterase